MSSEPPTLAEGKAFDVHVQRAFAEHAGELFPQHRVLLKSGRVGVADIWLDAGQADDETLLVLAEAKATNWDKCALSNIRRQVQRHARQIWKYTEVALDSYNLDVTPLMVFRAKPADLYRQRVIEALFMERGVLVLWLDSYEQTPYELFTAADAGSVLTEIIESLPESLLPRDRSSGLPQWIYQACRESRAPLPGSS